MAKRKVTVDGKEYFYSVGRTHVKIDGVGAWLKEEVGTNMTHDEDDLKIAVTPDHIRQWIRSHA